MQSLSQPTPPLLDQPLALFLDIDGTLAPLAATPDEARIPDETLATIHQLCHYTHGAVALVSGRSLKEIDRLSHGSFSAAGQHGLELRIGDEIEKDDGHAPLITHIAKHIQQFAAAYPLLLVEEKGLSVALHYRRAPMLASLVEEKLTALQMEHADLLYLQHGKMVIELRIRGGGKGEAIERLLRTSSFAGKLPVFVGDDLTDEAGFSVVNALKGMSIKIGDGATLAQWRLASVDHCASWLQRLAQHLQPQPSPIL